MLNVLLACLAAAAAAANAPFVVTVTNGTLANGVHVGTLTSQLQRNVIDKLFPPVTRTDWASVSLVDSKLLRYLVLEGDYTADTPLTLPSLFVLKLKGSLHDDASFSKCSANGAHFAGMVMLNGSVFSAVVGGKFNATVHNATQAMAISVVNGQRNSIRDVRAVGGQGWTGGGGTGGGVKDVFSAIGITGGTHNEVKGCDVGGTPGRIIHARAIWTLATQRALIHHNHVHHAGMHSLDFDAYTSLSVCANNVCEDNTAEGIFVEETASSNTITANTCRRNKNGIGVYSNIVGPVQANVIVGNTVSNNLAFGISSGGAGHSDGSKHSDTNIFVGNTASGNGIAAFNAMHGFVEGDYWVSNHASEPTSEWAPILYPASANVSIFEPEH